MECRRIGNTDLGVSTLCMGTMQFGWSADKATSLKVLSAGYDNGINFVDTADIYSRWVPGNSGGEAETIVGEWLKYSDISRDKVIIATKLRGQMGDTPAGEGLSPAYISKAVEASLDRLQTDYIDLYQPHWSDPNIPIEETLRAFEDLIKQGKVRYIGCSNYKADELRTALATAIREDLPHYKSLQPHYNLLHRQEFEEELAEICSKNGLGVIPYSPLAGGFLTGKYRKGQPVPVSVRAGHLKHAMTDENFALIDKMDLMAKDKNASISQIALAWLLANPLVTSPIIGPNKLSQLEDNLAVLDIKLTSNEKQVLDDATAWN
jgi:aryl-alcohol dehydrogenase-like predicted oxidoreductase